MNWDSVTLMVGSLSTDAFSAHSSFNSITVDLLSDLEGIIAAVRNSFIDFKR